MLHRLYRVEHNLPSAESSTIIVMDHSQELSARDRKYRGKSPKISWLAWKFPGSSFNIKESQPGTFHLRLEIQANLREFPGSPGDFQAHCSIVKKHNQISYSQKRATDGIPERGEGSKMRKLGSGSSNINNTLQTVLIKNRDSSQTDSMYSIF